MTAGPGGRGLTIGTVLEQLQQEFPDLTVSKLRFLDTKGLVSPQRRESGYREYSTRDIERLRFVLTAQRDRFWPLKVIQEALEKFDRGLAPDLGEATGRPVPPEPVRDESVPTAQEFTAELADVADVRLTRAEIAEGAGLSEAAVAELETFHLIQAQDGHYRAQDLTVARAAKSLEEFGLGGRHLRAFRLAADREVGLAQQAGGNSAARRAEIVSRALALHVALVKSALRD
ncbi:MerR family transcriptional regulator [Dermacoccaceae bacterium W4C1]